ncbi:MAG: hypothetical protein LBE32_05475 [Burkholderiales bacterium]|nr:hypothetical protein [Burkholderiales bacterium]
MNGLTYSYLRAAEARDTRRKQRADHAILVIALLIFAALLALVFGT